jgi:AraC-like DNA-binding protein
MRVQLRTRLAERWSLDQLAEEVHLSRSQLVRCFDATVGMSPMAYIRHMRVQQMARLLASTDFRLPRPLAPSAGKTSSMPASAFTPWDTKRRCVDLLRARGIVTCAWVQNGKGPAPNLASHETAASTVRSSPSISSESGIGIIEP